MLALGTIILGSFISDTDYGLYVVAMVPTTTLILFHSWGVDSALTKYCANNRATNREKELRKIITTGLVFEVGVGLILTVVLLSISGLVASAVYQKPESSSLIMLSSITILSTSIFTGAQAVFVGCDRMDLSSVTMVAQAVTQGLFSPLLVILGLGAFGAVLGFTLASVVTGLSSAILLYFFIYKRLPKTEKTDNRKSFELLKPLLQYGLPLAAATILSGLLTQFSSFIMGSSIDLALIGNYKIALNFGILATFFTVPISTVLFPAFSKIDSKSEQGMLKSVFASATKYTSLLIVPLTAAMVALASPIIGTIYGDKWPFAPWFLIISVIGNMFVVLGSISVDRLLYATGETKLLMKTSLLTLCVGVPVVAYAIPTFGITGLILGTMISGVPRLLYEVYWAHKHYGVKADFNSSGRIVLASAVAAITSYLCAISVGTTYWLQLLVGLLVFLSTYMLVVPVVGGISLGDLNNLRTLLSGLGVFSKVLEIPIILLEKPLKLKAKASKRPK